MTGDVTGDLTGTVITAAQANITSVGTLTSLAVSGDLTVDTSTLKVDSSNNRVGVLNASPAVSLDAGSATDAFHVPVGTTAQRPSGAAGHFRYNTTLEQFEGYTDDWGQIGGGGGANAFATDSYTGDGSTTAYALSQVVVSEDNLLVFIEGVFQQQDAYSIATAGGATTLTFSAAPANGNDILIYSVVSAISGTNLNSDTMTGDGSDTTLTLSLAPVNENNTQVYIDGVYQNKDTYSISGTTLTFSAAPPNGSAVEVMTMNQLDINTPTDGSVTPAKIASGDFYFDTDTLYVDATNDRVGINLTNPSSPLEVAGGSAYPTTKISRDGGSAATQGYLTTGFSAIGYSGGTGADAYMVSEHGFGFAVNAGTSAMTITDGGLVGIGTSSPTSTFRASIKGDYSSVIGGIEFDSGGGDKFTIGHASATSPSGTLNVVEAGNLIFKTSNTERMRIDASGRLLMGRTTDFGSSGYKLQVDFSGTTTGILVASAATASKTALIMHDKNNGSAAGSITYDGLAAQYNTSSDQRLKENIVDSPSASDDIDAIQVRSFDWKADGSHQKYGMVAQELVTVAPEAVSQPEDPDEMMGVDYSKLVPMMIKEIQNLRREVAALKENN
jgi:hypothetical protein